MLRFLYIVIGIVFNLTVAFARDLVINEIMATNVATICDSDGDYPDWIELYNAGSVRMNLKGYGLSDDTARPFNWIFPDIAIEPQAFLLIFASGKDMRVVPTHWETVCDWGDDWKYLVPDSQSALDWRTLEFDDSNWLVGASGFGYGDNDDATNLGSADPFQPSPISVYIRKKFSISAIEDVTGARLHVDYDDGFVAYLNGREIARANIGLVGEPPRFNQFADQPREARMYRGGEPEEYVLENIQSLLQAGVNVLALEAHNAELYSSDLTLIPFFTLELTAVPANARGPSPHLHFPESGNLHTNFKINTAGETIQLTNPTGNPIDQVTPGYLPADVSWGRQPDGSSNWVLFNEPTPGLANLPHGFTGIAPGPTFSLAGGFFQAPVKLELLTNSPGTLIRYTLDGSEPRVSSLVYQSPLVIDSTTVVRARVSGNDLLPGRIITQTFFINQNFSIPVISLATDPANFWDRDIGIYVFGDSADTVNYPYWGSNFWQDWERPVSIEFFEPDGRPGFRIDAGVKIFGSWSRLFPQKALAIFARSRYGYNDIPYQIFPDKPITSFQAIVLRNAGQDWGRTFFRDAMIQSLVKDTGLDIQAYRPALVFINGQVWGIHNIREKMNEHYLAGNHGIDPDNIDFLERDSMIIKGDAEHYKRLLDYVANHDLQSTDNFAYVNSLMDVTNFADYTLSVLYFANPDWPWNNVKCWRPKTQAGRWRWLLFDLDYCFHGGHLGPDANTFDEMRGQDNGTTFLFFKLLENDNYRNTFINRFADHLNTTFASSRVVRIINEFKAGIEAEMPVHIKKWRGTFEGPWWLGKSIDSMAEWYSHIDVTIDFANRRPEFMRQHIITEFELMDGGIGTIHLNIAPAGGGRVKINSLVLDAYPWSGQYFVQVPVTIMALPDPGYRFDGWTGVTPTDSPCITFNFMNNQTITATFKPDSSGTEPVIINEINYNSSASFDTKDWVELYNNSNQVINISNWLVKDAEDSHCFFMPVNTLLEANGYLVLCRDQVAFNRFFPQVTRCLGNLPFGLSRNGELLRLFDATGTLVDSVHFDSKFPWPDKPDGVGHTLELIDPTQDNTLPDNWAASTVIGGTPGKPNSVFVAVIDAAPGLPTTCSLEQNYPNPFNSQTVIRFSIAKPEDVSLKIYNTRGELVKVLVDKNLESNRYQVIWNGMDQDETRLSSGIYFYCLKTPTFCHVKKMIFIS